MKEIFLCLIETILLTRTYLICQDHREIFRFRLKNSLKLDNSVKDCNLNVFIQSFKFSQNA